MNVTLKTTQELIEKVQKDMDSFNNKTAGEPVWKTFHEIENDDSFTVDPKILDFVRYFETPPTDGTAKELMNYYSRAIKEIEKAGLDVNNVSFFLGEEDMEVSMLVTPINNMSNEEYYKEIVFNKGELISFQKENARNLEKVNKTHEEYTKHLDEEMKKKLDEVHNEKIKPFQEINDLLETAISKVATEEMKYKPAKKMKR